jgi:hypothetical protein
VYFKTHERDPESLRDIFTFLRLPVAGAVAKIHLSLLRF